MINYHAYHIIQRFWQKCDAFHDDMGKEILIFIDLLSTTAHYILAIIKQLILFIFIWLPFLLETKK